MREFLNYAWRKRILYIYIYIYIYVHTHTHTHTHTRGNQGHAKTDRNIFV